MITDEKRAFKRVKRKFTVKYKSRNAAGPVGGTSLSENISLGGVYFISLDKFEIGQILDCRISIPGAPEEGKWTARVVRCDSVGSKMVNTFGTAVEFVESFGSAAKDLKRALSASS